MTAAYGGGAGRIVRCPICMDLTVWPDGSAVWMWDASVSQYRHVNISGLDPTRREEVRRRGYQTCDNPSAGPDAPRHYLPATYAGYQEPLVIGLVGAPQSGKSHLLTAMILEVLNGGLTRYALDVEPLDFLQHEDFKTRYLEPFERGTQLGGTVSGVVTYAESLLVRGPSGERPVVFFDVSGEDLQQLDDRDRGGRFLVAAGALLFVYAPEDPLDLAEQSRGARALSGDGGQAFALSLARVRAKTAAERLPTAIAVTKADRLRYRPPAEFWLSRGTEETLDAARVRKESRDVFAYLRQAGAGAALAPFDAFTRCTLHFVSASGGDASNNDFPRGVRPLRVLEPLVSILAMAGVITGPEAPKVGTP